jgi:hypothetical protein
MILSGGLEDVEQKVHKLLMILCVAFLEQKVPIIGVLFMSLTGTKKYPLLIDDYICVPRSSLPTYLN